MRSRKLTPDQILCLCARKGVYVSDAAIRNVLNHPDFVTEDGPWRAFAIVPADFFLYDGVYVGGLKSVLEEMAPATTPRPEDAFSLASMLADGEVDFGYEQVLIGHEPFTLHNERVGYRLMIRNLGRRGFLVDACQLLPNATLSVDWGLLIQEGPQKVVRK